MPFQRVVRVSVALFAAAFLSATAYAQGSSSEPPKKVVAEATLGESSPGLHANAGEQTVVVEEAADRMKWVVGGYLHAVDISGSNTVGDVEVPIDVSFGDLFSIVKVPFSLNVEGMKGRWGFGVDYLYIKVGDESFVDTPLPIEITVGADFIISNFEAFGTYRIGRPSDPAGSLDLMFGPRWRRLSLGVEISGLPQTIGGGFDESWWDFLLGGRWVKKVHPRVGLIARADFGSDVWQVNGGVGINVWRKLDLLIQYRHVDIDHEQGSGNDFFAYDGTESGPLFGFGLHF
jgi:hypothetical protein